jgi:hypothetical protein
LRSSFLPAKVNATSEGETIRFWSVLDSSTRSADGFRHFAERAT